MGVGRIIREDSDKPFGGCLATRDSSDEAAATVAGWLSVVLLSIVFAFPMIDRSMLALLIQPIKADLSIGDAAFGIAHRLEAMVAGFTLYTIALGGALAAGPTALQLRTPIAMQGRINPIYVVVISLIGTALGPLAVGLATDWLRRDENEIGVAIVVVSLAFNMAAIFLFSIGCGSAGALIQKTQRQSRATPHAS